MLVLVDVSGVTDSWGAGQRPINDVERDLGVRSFCAREDVRREVSDYAKPVLGNAVWGRYQATRWPR